jgi:RNA polymerase sigma-70 factor (ECF subfamily)
MSNREHSDLNDARRLETFNRHRGRVFSVAYGMLGEVADAEDAVQDTYLRWQGLTDEQLQRVRSPEDYLAAVVVRLSLDRLRSARARREEYVGPWLPEPLLTEPESGETEVVAEESLSVAVMVLLESLTPVQRAVFLLREVFGYGYGEISRIVGRSEANCRQIARRAKASVAARRPRFKPSSEEHEDLMRRLVEAASGGDMDGLLSLLSEDAAVYTDGGGEVTAARNPVLGRDRAARFILGVLDKRRRQHDSEEISRFSVSLARVNAGPGLVGYVDDEPVVVVSVEVTEARIRRIYIVLNPKKLSAVPRLP